MEIIFVVMHTCELSPISRRLRPMRLLPRKIAYRIFLLYLVLIRNAAPLCVFFNSAGQVTILPSVRSFIFSPFF